MSESQNAPIVLVHGILGFDRLMAAGVTIATYFRGVPEALRADGHTVPEPPALNPAGSVAERAQDLKSYLENNSGVAGQKVHLIAHSMGGLDSRFMISKLGMMDLVWSLTTICTPHHGSPIADSVEEGGGLFLEKLSRIGLDVQGNHDLTTKRCAQFNQDVQDVPGVAYFCISGQINPPISTAGILGFTHDIISIPEGANDGLVSVRSATFAERPNWNHLDTWDASHLRVINWGVDVIPSPSELADNSIVEKYLALAASVKARVN